MYVSEYENAGDKVFGKINKHGDIAQLGEHLPCTQGVKSSNLFISTTNLFKRFFLNCRQIMSAAPLIYLQVRYIKEGMHLEN